MIDPQTLKRILMRRLLVLLMGAFSVTGFAIWFIVSHAPKPDSPAELSP
jgi:hypothetical protein